jgi:release factor glutamine methyltransferase
MLSDPQRLRIRDCLARATLPRLELSLLLSSVLEQSRVWLIAHDDEVLRPESLEAFLALEARRQAGEPIAYLLGWREFMGHRLVVSPSVLIPRPETEVLVEAVLASLAEDSPIESTSTKSTSTENKNPEILDLGTGSGAIALSLSLALVHARVVATDISAPALEVAQKNAEQLGARVTFLHGSWFEPLAPNERFDVIVSNPPYVHPSDDHLGQGDLRFEPKQALTDGVDGLSAYRDIIDQARLYLKPGGWLWVEHGHDQAESVQGLLDKSGFKDIKTLKDLGAHPRVTAGSYNSSN